MGKSSGGTTQTIQNNDPWGPAQPYLRSLFGRADKLYRKHANDPITVPGATKRFWGGAKKFGPGEISRDYFAGSQNYADAGSPSLLGAASDQATKTLRGDYLTPDSNPYLKASVDQALGQTKSAVNANFGGDSFGNSAHQEWLGKQLADTALPMYNQNYQSERDRQFSAMGAAQGITGAQHGIQMDKLGLLGDAGQQQNALEMSRLGLLDQAGQQQGDFQAQKRNQGWDNLMRYQQAIGGAASAGGKNTTTQPYHENKAANAASTAMTAYLMYSMFSDRRLKRDIERIGTHALGVGIYSFRYIWDDIFHIGVMADEVEKVRPEAVIGGPNGFKLVNYSMLETA